jgi:hypothetical protein
MKTLSVKSFGPIHEGTVEFGDLTVLVGPQATGKSLFVQLFKAVEDAGSIRKTLKDYGFDWLREKDPKKSLNSFLALYFGEGMESIWRDASTQIEVDGERLDFDRKVVRPPSKVRAEESVFLIPAQRVLVLQGGWPSPAFSRDVETPHCTRVFSDKLRQLLNQGLDRARAIFPQPHRLKEELRRLLDVAVYVGGTLRLDTVGRRRRLVLQPAECTTSLPYSTWSAGQREFTPLLLGLYWLMPSTKITKRESIKTVIIEEPETGLHPQAIMTFCLVMLELLWRGYKVIVSTHSPVVLDVIWALRDLKSIVDEDVGVESLKKIFSVSRLEPNIRRVLSTALHKEYKVYYFDRPSGKTNVHIRDISSLDPGDEDPGVSGWGGLSGFSGKVADIVGEAIAKGNPDAPSTPL